MALVANWIYVPHVKKARLEADTQASALTGKKYFLDALRKIDGMRLDDVEKLKAGRGRPWASVAGAVSALPSITERIENLQGFPQVSWPGDDKSQQMRDGVSLGIPVSLGSHINIQVNQLS